MKMCAVIGQMHEFLMSLKKAGFTDEIIQDIINSKGNALAKKMLAAIQAIPVQETKDGEFVLRINYSRTLNQMIAAGQYDWTNSGINEENFPLPIEMSDQNIELKAKLFHFNRSISRDQIIAEMDKAGFRPATLSELLSLGEADPELQRQFPVIALASLWRGLFGCRFVPYLDVVGSRRKLRLGWLGLAFFVPCRFLAVRKEE